MVSSEAKNIQNVFDPIHKLSVMFGFTVFSINQRNGSFKFFISRENIFASIIHSVWSFYWIFFFVSTYLESSKVDKNSAIEVYRGTLSFISPVFIVSSIFINWKVFASRRIICDMMNLLKSVDDDLRHAGYPMNYKKQKKHAVCLLIVLSILIIIGTAIAAFVNNFNKTFANWEFVLFAVLIYIVHWVLINTQIFFWMWMVKARFETLNLFLQEEFLRFEKEIRNEGNLKIRKAAVIFEKLSEACECFNKSYGVSVRNGSKFDSSYNVFVSQVMLLMAINFVYVTLCTYGGCRGLFFYFKPLPIILNTFGWGIGFGAMTYSIIHTGHFSRREVRLLVIAGNLFKAPFKSGSQNSKLHS
jgi:hypothetical protein